jgi:hypothetical protein
LHFSNGSSDQPVNDGPLQIVSAVASQVCDQQFFIPVGRFDMLLCSFGPFEAAPVAAFAPFVAVVFAPVVVPLVTGMRSRGMLRVVSQHWVSVLIISDLPVPCAPAKPMLAARIAVAARAVSDLVMMPPSGFRQLPSLSIARDTR